MRSSPTIRPDLLATRFMRTLLRSPAFPVALQAIALVAVFALILVGFGVGAGAPPSELLILRKTNLATLIVWGVWWPSMIAVAIAFGRAWCTVCPMELVNRMGDAIARKLALPRLKLGRWLRAGWLVVAAYLLLQLLVGGLSIHRVPHFTALFLLALLTIALLTGLLFHGPRSFCTAFCPAGALLSVYGRLTPVQLEMRDPSLCARCVTKDCVIASNRLRFDKRSCPSLLRPFDRSASDPCVLCMQCAKVCSHDNVGFGVVSPEAPIRRRSMLRPHEAGFVMVALGFVSHEVIGEVKWLDAAFHTAPKALARLLPTLSFDWIESLWFLVLFPAAVWIVISAAAWVAGHRNGLRTLLLAAATGAAPVVAIAHLAKALAKLFSWIGFVPLALRDPSGLETARQIGAHALQAPASILGIEVVGWLTLALIALVAIKAWRWVRTIPADAITAARVGLGGAAILFGAVLSIWSWPLR